MAGNARAEWLLRTAAVKADAVSESMAAGMDGRERSIGMYRNIATASRLRRAARVAYNMCWSQSSRRLSSTMTIGAGGARSSPGWTPLPSPLSASARLGRARLFAALPRRPGLRASPSCGSVPDPRRRVAATSRGVRRTNTYADLSRTTSRRPRPGFVVMRTSRRSRMS